MYWFELSNCKVSLNQGRWTWRHDNLLHYISQVLDKTKYEVYVDIPGHQTPNGGTVPTDVLVTGDRPDVVIIDREKKTCNIFELTVPYDVETNINAAQLRKKNKYAYFLTDVTSLAPTVTPFEVATRGFVSTQNRDRLKLLHKFCKRNVKLKTFIENLSALAVNSSYYLFVCRKEPVFSDPPPLTAPFTTP